MFLKIGERNDRLSDFGQDRRTRVCGLVSRKKKFCTCTFDQPNWTDDLDLGLDLDWIWVWIRVWIWVWIGFGSGSGFGFGFGLAILAQVFFSFFCLFFFFEMEHGKVKSLFELQEGEFVGSITGITNGKEGLAQMLAGLHLKDEEDPEDDEDEVQSQASSEHGAKEQQQQQQEQDEDQEKGLTCRTCDVTFPRYSIRLGPKEIQREIPQLFFFFFFFLFLCVTVVTVGDSVEEQREHFKLDWHRCNVKRKLEKRSPVTEDDFDKLLEKAGLVCSSSSIFCSHSSDCLCCPGLPSPLFLRPGLTVLAESSP